MMMDFIKKYWWVWVFLLLMPIIINVLYLIETSCQILHEPSKWTVFWGAYISGIASFFMLLVAWRTLKETIKANSDLQQRYEEDAKPKISLSIVQAQENDYNIEIVNYGKNLAANLRLAFIIPEKFREKYRPYLEDETIEFRSNGLEILYPNTKVSKPLFKTNGKLMCLYGCLQIPFEQDMWEEIIKHHSMCHLEVEYSYDNETEIKKTSLTFPFSFWC